MIDKIPQCHYRSALSYHGNFQLSPHGCKMTWSLPSIICRCANNVLFAPEFVTIDLFSHALQEVEDWLCEPSASTTFKPAEMTAQRSRQQNRHRILLELLKWKGFADGYGIIFRIDSKVRYSDGQNGIRGAGVAIVCSLGGVSPCRPLDHPIELIEVGDVAHSLDVDAGVLRDLVDMAFEKSFHIGAHHL